MKEIEYKKLEEIDNIDIEDDTLTFIEEVYKEKVGENNKSTKKEDN